MNTVHRLLPRLGQYALVLWLAATLNFALPHLAPGNPVSYLYGGDVNGLTDEQLAEISARYGLDASLFDQYIAFWSNLFRGDLGMSVQHNRPVTEVLLDHLPWTLLLVTIGTLLAATVGILLGALAAWRRGTRSDAGLVIGVLTVDAMPGFWVGMLLIAVFAVQLGLFPSYGAATISGDGAAWLAEVAQRLVLPSVTVALAVVGSLFLLTRAAMLSVLDEPFIRLARAKGLTERRIAVRHALRNALLPVYTNLTVTIGSLLSGVVVIETVFSYPGLGRLLYDAVIVRDYPMLQGGFLMLTVAVIALNLLADLTYPLLDPRVRRDSGSHRTPSPSPTEALP